VKSKTNSSCGIKRTSNLVIKPRTSQGIYNPIKRNLETKIGNCSSIRGTTKKAIPQAVSYRKESVGPVQKKTPGKELFKSKRSPTNRKPLYPYNSTSHKALMPPLLYHKVSDLKRKTNLLEKTSKPIDKDEQVLFDLCQMKLSNYEPSTNYTLSIKTQLQDKKLSSPRQFMLSHANGKRTQVRRNQSTVPSIKTNRDEERRKENMMVEKNKRQRRKRGDRKKQKEEHYLTTRDIL